MGLIAIVTLAVFALLAMQRSRASACAQRVRAQPDATDRQTDVPDDRC